MTTKTTNTTEREGVTEGAASLTGGRPISQTIKINWLWELNTGFERFWGLQIGRCLIGVMIPHKRTLNGWEP